MKKLRADAVSAWNLALISMLLHAATGGAAIGDIIVRTLSGDKLLAWWSVAIAAGCFLGAIASFLAMRASFRIHQRLQRARKTPPSPPAKGTPHLTVISNNDPENDDDPSHDTPDVA